VFCPNRECRDYQLTGFHADFVDGVTVCPTCGAALVELPDPDDRDFEGDDGYESGLDERPGLPIDVEPVIETSNSDEVPQIRALLDASWIPHIVLQEAQIGRLMAARPSFIYEALEGAFVFLVPTRLAEEARDVLAAIEDPE
jgi:hypothetical protein